MVAILIETKRCADRGLDPRRAAGMALHSMVTMPARARASPAAAGFQTSPGLFGGYLLCRVAAQEFANGAGNLADMSFKREMAAFVEMHFGIGVVAFECFGAWRQEERIVFAPNRQQWRTHCAEVFLEFRVERDVARIVQEQVELNLVVTRPSQ